MQHTFFVHFFAVGLHHYNVKPWIIEGETSRNFLLSCTFLGGTVVRVLYHFCSLLPIAMVALAFLILSPPLQNFHVVLPTKKMSPLFFFFVSRSRSLSPFSHVELRWPTAYFLFFSVFLLLYIPNLWAWQLI